ncbi:SapC family protein [Shewanella donghaensis]|uniref:SapC family protein n=1 Tax=Shewanella donghaensis TaxID=238836 RepID=UPI001182F3C5|nr:SapC family protein [Shewanella donghaensis]
MSNTIVNLEQHKHTKVITGHGKQFGENIHFVPVIADELRQLLLEYPCCFLKNNETGQFGLHALLGFEAGENLFLKGDSWTSSYIPMHIKRQPFMVGKLGDTNEPASKENTVLTIDMGSNRIQTTEDNQLTAQALFDNDDQPSSFLKDMHQMVFTLTQGIVRTDSFIQSLVTHDLIEAVQIGVTLANGQQKFDGLYVINEEQLAQLAPTTLVELHGNGYLQACYLMIASMGNLQKLIHLKNMALDA